MIPIFRAKILDSDEYIIGDLFDGNYIIAKSELNRNISEALKHIREDILTKECISDNCKNEHHLLNKMLNKLLVNERLEHIYEIDPTTISIHFPTILDNQGNKIFTNYQGIKRRLDDTVTTLAVLQNENKSLVKTLEKYNEEMIELRKENQDLKNSNNELLKGLKSTQKRLEEWLEKCK